MSDADSSADTEPPCSGSTTDNKSITICNTDFITSGEKYYGCLKYHPMHFHSEVRRPKAPFNPRVFDWSIANKNFSKLVVDNNKYAQFRANFS